MKLHLRKVKLDEDKIRLALRKECLERRVATIRDACAAMAQAVTEHGTGKKVARK